MVRLVFILLLLGQGAFAATSSNLESIASLTMPQEVENLAPTASSDPALDALGSLALPLSSWPQIRDRIRTRAAVCDNCHAATLHQGNDYLPVLQGQNREYLYLKIKSFAVDPQSRHPFPKLSRSLQPHEIVDLSLYYALQRSRLNLDYVRLAGTWQEELKGARSQLHACHECHGLDGNGGGSIPDLSGQNRGYLSYRIRENASRATVSNGHLEPGPRCKIEPVSIEQSRHLAAALALVIDRERVLRGAQIFDQNCSLCHNDAANAPDLYRLAGWLDEPLQGAEQLTQAAMRKKDAGPQQRSFDMNRNQWRDVMHYLIDRIGLD